jgi:hypothetical protein
MIVIKPSERCAIRLASALTDFERQRHRHHRGDRPRDTGLGFRRRPGSSRRNFFSFLSRSGYIGAPRIARATRRADECWDYPNETVTKQYVGHSQVRARRTA